MNPVIVILENPCAISSPIWTKQAKPNKALFAISLTDKGFSLKATQP